MISTHIWYNTYILLCYVFTLPAGGYGWVPMDQQNTLLWVPCNSGDPLPRGAVHVGTDKGGDPLYAGRAFYEGDLLPAKINSSHSSAYVCWGGMEHALSHYEVRSILFYSRLKAKTRVVNNIIQYNNKIVIYVIYRYTVTVLQYCSGYFSWVGEGGWI